MVDLTQVAPTRNEASLRGTAILCYVLYLLGWPTVHVTTIVALILAYVQRSEARGTSWESHYRNLIETFWISMIIGIVAIPLCFVFIGIPILIGLGVWFLYRTIKGLVRAIEARPYV
ncbi:MAG: hypothetical protein JOY77_12180 [Alphaproteobacteria bacterium]|nr:hypothetical protein [Alphaproteobacteria bacterium]MBV9063668.1 hypothetical protein [Alphaproteobacteria bacterium]MBV9914448.1 hypothetical protein [Nevskiaceae bacterium]